MSDHDIESDLNEIGQDDGYIGPGSTIGPLPSTINAAYRQAVRQFKQACTANGGFWTGSGDNLQCLGGEDAYETAAAIGESAPAYTRAQEWLNNYGGGTEAVEETPELTQWQTNKDYIVSQCTDGACPNADMQSWYDRWVFSGMPETKDGMQSVEDYEAATQPQGPTIEDLTNEYGQDLVDRAQELYDVFSSKIEGAIDDPLGTLKNILDTVLPQLPPECKDGPKPDDWWKDCTNLRVITSLPGIDLQLPGIFDIEATVRDIENAIVEAGKTLDDFINNPRGTIDAVIEDMKTAVEDAWAGIEDKTSGGLLDWLIDGVGVVVGGFILGSIEDHVKEAIDPLGLIANCYDPKYAESEKGKTECNQYVEQGSLELCEDGTYAEECPEVISPIEDIIQPSVRPGDPCGFETDESGNEVATGKIGSDGETCISTTTGETVEEEEEDTTEIGVLDDTTQPKEGQACDSNGDGTLDGKYQQSGFTFGGESGSTLTCVASQTGEEEEEEEEVVEVVEETECTNGATNYPDCNRCPPGYVLGGLTFGGESGKCVPDTNVEDPECNDCTCDDFAAANPLECGWEECPDGSFAETVALCGSGGGNCPEGTEPCEALGGECATPEACIGAEEEEEEAAGGGGGGGGGSGGLFKPFTPTLSGDPELLARQEFPITDFLMGLFTGK